jgi:peptidoglycan/xylan/chitin deacetylase (PgdA/CDA1 family)
MKKRKRISIKTIVFIISVLIVIFLLFIMFFNKREGTGIVSITFDDGYENFYDYAFPLMEFYNYTGTLYYITNWSDDFEYRKLMSFTELKILQDSGWEIGSHRLKHRAFANLSREELVKELQESKKILENNSIIVNSLSYPFGSHNDLIIEESRNYYSSARTMGGGYNNLNNIKNQNLKSNQVRINYRPEEICIWIKNIRFKNQWLVINFHYIDNKENRVWDESIEDFKKILHCINDSGIKVVNVGDVIKKYGE